MVFSSASSHSVPGPLGPTERVREGTDAHPSNAVTWTPPLGLEIMTPLSKGSRSPDERKGRKLGSPVWWWPGLGPPPLPQFSWREGSPWQGWALLLWLLALLARASDQMAICPLDLI